METYLDPTLIAQGLAKPQGTWREHPKAAPYIPTIERVAAETGVPVTLLGELVRRESQFNPNAKSQAGAVGLAQLMPIHHSMVNPRDPEASLAYSAKYLKGLEKRFGGWEPALAAYNAGPGNVRRAQYKMKDKWRMALPPETQAYITALSGYAK